MVIITCLMYCHTKGHSSGEREINARQSTLKRKLLKCTTVTLLLIWNHRSNNEARAIMQDFLEKGESSTCKLQPIKKKKKHKPLSPNTTPLSRGEFWRLRHKRKQWRGPLNDLSAKILLLGSWRKAYTDSERNTHCKRWTLGNKKTWQDWPPNLNSL